MPRIVAGRARGRRLSVPGRGTRPTSDRTREALFDSLAGLLDLDGAVVLDLFAGTGAVGLEALSRGAGRVVFVESDRRAATVLTANVDTVGLSGATIRLLDARSYLAGVPEDGEGVFDFVFADPPYALSEEALATLLARLVDRLSAAAIVVVERSRRSPAPSWPDVIEPIKSKQYGESMLWYGRPR